MRLISVILFLVFSFFVLEFFVMFLLDRVYNLKYYGKLNFRD